MVQKIIALWEKEWNGLHTAAYLIAGFTFVAQLLAIVRDRLLAHMFGAGSELDVYYAAFRIPDFLYVAIASLVSISVLIPFLAERLRPENTEEAKRFIRGAFTFFALTIGGGSLLAFFAVPALSNIWVPGFSEAQRDLFVSLTRLLLLSPILLGISSILGSVVQVYRKFFVYAIAPVVYNIGIILGIVLFADSFGMYGVAWGVVLGASLHLLIQLPVFFSHGFSLGFERLSLSELRNVISLALPRTIALSAANLSFISLIAAASFLADGSIAVFTFAFNLQSVPLAIIGVSYSIAAFPTLARLTALGAAKEFAAHVSLAARHILLWSIPVIVLFVVLRAQIVRVTLGSGLFDWTDTRLTAATLALFVISLAAQGIALLLTRAFYAAGKTKIPLFVNVGASSIAAVSGIGGAFFLHTSNMARLFMEDVLRISYVPGSEVVILAAAYAIGQIVAGILLFLFFRRDVPGFSLSLGKSFFQITAASLVMGAVAYYTLIFSAPFLNTDTFLGIFTQGACAGMLGVAAGIAMLVILDNREVREVAGALHRRMRPATIIAPDQEEL
ncbi:MAG: lipid II flippase MurJ [Patescibacteria group bacterium]